jgi:hypothetical protein
MRSRRAYCGILSAKLAYNGAMELECLEYKIVMEDRRDTEVLGRLANLHMATAAYMAAIARYPKRNITLRQGTRSSSATTGSRDRNHRATRTRAAGRCTSSAGSAWRDSAS